eukprot:scaffold72979_cov59-Phaeocystis_antarctica.AAC.3
MTACWWWWLKSPSMWRGAVTLAQCAARRAHRRPLGVAHDAQCDAPRLRLRRARRWHGQLEVGPLERVLRRVDGDRREVAQAAVGMPRDGDRPQPVVTLLLGALPRLGRHPVEQHQVEAVALAAVLVRTRSELCTEGPHRRARGSALWAAPRVRKHANAQVLVRDPWLPDEAARDPGLRQPGADAHRLSDIGTCEEAVRLDAVQALAEAAVEAAW